MILIGLGSNLASRAGSPKDTLDAALVALKARGVRTLAVSPYYRSPAWPDPSDPEFVNAVARIGTTLSPPELAKVLQAVENAFGRTRVRRNAPRTLDLDLLDYNGCAENGPLVLPHPRMARRAFVLVPLRDVAPDWRHPVSGQSVEELIAALPAAGRSLARI